MNPHFYGLLLQGFLSGYNKPCEIRIIVMALPILLSSESRKKLVNANSRSKMETLFNKTCCLENDIKISGKVSLSGYIKRFEELKSYSKKALVILYSKKIILIKDKKIYLIEPIEYKKFKNIVREWLKAAHYLGVVFSKSNEDQLNHFLGVDRQ